MNKAEGPRGNSMGCYWALWLFFFFFLLATILVGGQFLFKMSVQKLYKRPAHKFTGTRRWQRKICSATLPVHVNEGAVPFLVIRLGSEESLLVPVLVSGMDSIDVGRANWAPVRWSWSPFSVRVLVAVSDR